MTDVTPDADALVIGGGVIGLAIARELQTRGREVLLIERNDRLGAETTSRNSEVIHAGLYYPPGSMRARLCVAGKELLYKFCEENGVAAKRVGKLLVATADAELPRLKTIAETAAKNGVGDLVAMTADEARALEPEVACVAAYFSPSTGVIDSHGLVQALEGHITTNGGMVVLNTNATRISRTADDLFSIEIESGGEHSELTCRSLVVAAGHGATALLSASGLGDYKPLQTYPARGHYYSLSGRTPFKHLVYPMPQGGWLGLHFTLDIAGRGKFGPDIEWQDTLSYDFDDSAERRAIFEREIRRYWPGLPDGALSPDYTGVRPKIYREGEPAADFTIHGRAEHGVDGLIALYGIESPGLTSSLAIAALVGDMVEAEQSR